MRCRIKSVVNKAFYLLGCFVTINIVYYIQYFGPDVTVTADRVFDNNSRPWFTGSFGQDTFFEGEVVAVSLEEENTGDSTTTNNKFGRKGKIQHPQPIRTFLRAKKIPMSASTRELTTSIYGDGCGDNPFRNRLQKLLRYWIKLVRPHIIQYFLCYGSLLGYHRTGDVIPYDHDVDMCVNRRDFERLSVLEVRRPIRFRSKRPHLIVQRKSPNGTALRRNCRGAWVPMKTDRCSILSPAARVILGNYNFLDVYPYVVDERQAEETDARFEPQHIYPVQRCLFMGLETRCPHNASALLAAQYGSDFARKPHHVCRGGEWVATGNNVTERKLLYVIEQREKTQKKLLRRKKRKRKSVWKKKDFNYFKKGIWVRSLWFSLKWFSLQM